MAKTKLPRIKQRALDPDPEDYGWVPIITVKNMEIYIIRTPEFNHVLARISPRYQPFWIRIKYLSFFHWKTHLWCVGTNKKRYRTWLGPNLSHQILNSLKVI